VSEFDSVLYVRVSADLLKKLDRIAIQEMKSHAGKKITRSDVARRILLDEIVRTRKKKKRAV
tara:strand:+ start:149 stop:334 length:186 start_codon:yes stop_codon:yes gene_type:complete